MCISPTEKHVLPYCYLSFSYGKWSIYDDLSIKNGELPDHKPWKNQRDLRHWWLKLRQDPIFINFSPKNKGTPP